MSDPILAELQEDFRREQFKQWMNRYGGAVLVAAVILVFATGAYTLWQQHQQGKLQAVTGELYQAAGPQSRQQPDAAAAQLDAFASQHQGNTQADLARLMEAALRQRASQPQEAMASFSKVIDSGTADDSLRGVATLLYVQTALDTAADPAELQGKLAPYQAAGSPFRFMAWELGALAAHKAGDSAKAQEFLDQLIKDGETPTAQRTRATELQRVL